MAATAGIARTTLLLVPRWHGAPPFVEDGKFVAWLRELAAAGHEICLHGYYHKVERIEGTWSERLVGRHYTRGEGEFYRLPRAEAARRLASGLALCRQAGLTVCGFTAPAWLLGREAAEAVREAGFRYTTRWSTVERLPEARTVRAPTLVWSTRRAWRRTASRAWVRLWGAVHRGSSVLRVAAHPGDFAHPAVAESLRCALAAAAADREGCTYAEWLTAEPENDADVELASV